MAQFALDINKFTNKVKGRENLVIRKICLDLHDGVTMRTPVDTGRARSNWTAGINNIDPTASPTANPSILAKAKAIITQLVAGDKIYITNNVDYINHLEDGSSKQAPSGMVKATLVNYPGIVARSAAETKREMI